ncbi:hypothetical protein ACSQ67_017945 [Phaseolus vulgaris]
MGRDDEDGFADYNDLLRTQALAVSACTTLVSVEPMLTVETRSHVMEDRVSYDESLNQRKKPNMFVFKNVVQDATLETDASTGEIIVKLDVDNLIKNLMRTLIALDEIYDASNRWDYSRVIYGEFD